MCLHAEDVAAHRVARSAMPRTRLAASRGLQRRELVPGIRCEEQRQQRLADRGQRAQRLEIADAPAIAVGAHALDPSDALIRNQHVPELAAESVAALDDMPVDDDAAAEPGADDCRDRRRFLGLPKMEKCPHSAPALPSLR